MAEPLQIEYVPADSLNPDEGNPREMTQSALERLAKLLDAHGFVDPIIARRGDGLIIGGHQRLRANAMRQTPDEAVPVVYLPGLSDARCKALNVALNNQEAQGTFDVPKLGDLLAGLADAGEFDVPEFTAFSAEDIAAMDGRSIDTELGGVPDPVAGDEAAKTIHCPKCGHEFPLP